MEVKKRWRLNKIKLTWENTVFHCRAWWTDSLYVLFPGLFEDCKQFWHSTQHNFMFPLSTETLITLFWNDIVLSCYNCEKPLLYTSNCKDLHFLFLLMDLVELKAIVWNWFSFFMQIMYLLYHWLNFIVIPTLIYPCYRFTSLIIQYKFRQLLNSCVDQGSFMVLVELLFHSYCNNNSNFIFIHSSCSLLVGVNCFWNYFLLKGT